MKSKHVLILFATMAFAIQCKKEEKPDYPCVGQKSFYCKINGKPFTTYGQFPCAASSQWYDPVSGNLSISGIDCNAGVGEPRLVTFYMFGIFQTGEYYPPVWNATCKYVGDSMSIRFDSTLAGKVNVTTFIERNYSADWQGGLFAGTFEFTLWNPDLNDTVYITEGQFCIPRY